MSTYTQTTASTETETILMAGAAISTPVTDHGGTPYIALPPGYQAHDLESLLPVPSRKRAAVTLTDTDSFISYIKKHGSLDECTLYAGADFEQSKLQIVAVINDHGADVASANWRDHTATYSPVQTVEWKRWMAKNNVPMSQELFATFLEDNIPDIASTEGMPSGNQMLEMALGFEATSDKRFKSKVALQGGGVRLEYIDDASKDTKASMALFERFALGLCVFLHGDRYRLDARLKYREKEGKLLFWFELIRADRVFENAANAEIAKINASTGFPVLFGNAGV